MFSADPKSCSNQALRWIFVSAEINHETFSLMKNSVQVKCIEGLSCLQMISQQDAVVEAESGSNETLD